MDDLNTEPAVKELSKSITEIASWKAAGIDGGLVPSMQVLFITTPT